MVAALPRNDPDFVTRLMNSAFSHSEDVSVVIRSYDFRKELLAQKPLHVGLAPEWRRSYDRRAGRDSLVSMAGTMRSLAKIPPQERSWDKIISTMTQTPLLEPDNAPVHRSAVLPLPKALGFVGNCDSSVIDRIKSWFVSLVGDQEIMSALAVDIVVLADSASRLGTQLSLPRFRAVQQETTLLDINVIRFPDTGHPFFELYMLKVDAWSQRWPLFVPKEDMNGLSGAFQAHKFRPRTSIINELSPQTLERAVQEAEALLDSQGRAAA
ncbi:uncharacterized protein PHACADRAFT_182694 [Phanerochaete carnosa HHB-10118-sp]|uniref:Uncharacterized protein n=1 Tax=Phanerochaete carnosa (strain HHB-10118-sp) TaxID=650164 RepID=K5V6M1_PHACS|nr:uncharacterized protein PHACADRAFT_182694 [Phanerochaete carnosa HHB-10118-sp]EKM58346.1 hypothetical protein PHACADRAFT_182694 [Phanerochaete carnosa HHB-10118-sp]